ncbi:GTP-binding protein [endosymbiont of Lamellibrachia barhami]|uniref:GTP-binding protein n=1 Tax=endosymbiont of Lamellibrachia barhami TaxID=205975 RepID=UPI00272C15DB|nr:ATP/GTP-binding protein [endosymbiont of Lamellibrachia barhami]
MKKDLKIIFTGPVGAGKTTAINVISDTDTISTNESSTDEFRYRKNTTTVAMDYGIINMVDSKRVHLYGTPGQARFDFMWDILIQGGMGLVLLVDNARPDPLEDMQFFSAAIRGLHPTYPSRYRCYPDGYFQYTQTERIPGIVE